MPDNPIYCAFTFWDAPLNETIVAFTGGDVNHACFVYWDDELKHWTVTGANPNGVTTEALETFRKDHKIVHLLAPKFDLWQGLRDHVGDLDKKYNYVGLLEMAQIMIARRLLHKNVAPILQSHDTLFCSEWVDECIASALSHLPELAPLWTLHLSPDVVDPNTLCQAEIKCEKLFTVTDPKVLDSPWGTQGP